MARKRKKSEVSSRGKKKTSNEVASSSSVTAHVCDRQRLKELFISYILAKNDQTTFFDVILVQVRVLMQGYNGGASLAVREDLKEYLKGLAEDDDSQFTMLYIVFSFSMLLGSLFETEYKHIVESGSSVVLDVILTNHYLREDSGLDEAKIKDLIEGKIFDSNPSDVDSGF